MEFLVFIITEIWHAASNCLVVEKASLVEVEFCIQKIKTNFSSLLLGPLIKQLQTCMLSPLCVYKNVMCKRMAQTWHKCFVENYFSAIDTMCSFQKCACTKCQKGYFHSSCYGCTNAIFAWLSTLPWQSFSGQTYGNPELGWKSSVSVLFLNFPLRLKLNRLGHPKICIFNIIHLFFFCIHPKNIYIYAVIFSVMFKGRVVFFSRRRILNSSIQLYNIIIININHVVISFSAFNHDPR